jgi:hypothetical protein
MSAEFYEEMYETALELLEEFGQIVILRSFTPGAGGRYNPSTGKVATGSQTSSKDVERNAVVVDAPANRIGPQYGSNVEAGSRVQDISRWCYMDAKGSAPTQKDHVIFGGKTYNVFNVQEYNPAGRPLMYLLVLRA